MSSTNAEAHNAYLQGYFYFQRRNSDNLRKAISYFDDAIRLDPNYALAYAKSAEAWTWIADQSGVPHHEGWTIARKDAEKAVAIDPNLAEAHAALGWVLAFGEWKFQEGVSQARRAVELAPGSATATGVLSAVILYLGKTGEAEKWGRRAVEIDPLDYSARNNLARVLYVEGKLDEAIVQGKRAPSYNRPRILPIAGRRSPRSCAATLSLLCARQRSSPVKVIDLAVWLSRASLPAIVPARMPPLRN